MFDYSKELDDLILKDQTNTKTLKALRAKLGNKALPEFLIEYIKAVGPGGDSLAIHTSSSISGWRDADHKTITRDKGFIGKSQREEKKFPNAVQHIKILYNASGKARVFYKYKGSVQFVQNLRSAA